MLIKGAPDHKVEPDMLENSDNFPVHKALLWCRSIHLDPVSKHYCRYYCTNMMESAVYKTALIKVLVENVYYFQTFTTSIITVWCGFVYILKKFSMKMFLGKIYFQNGNSNCGRINIYIEYIPTVSGTQYIQIMISCNSSPHSAAYMHQWIGSACFR